ncbi:MAG: UbiD family decarboxylase [Desulfobacteraceae bacterium]|nr:UbiD family decarboxylase [Desulfobacteraceae bacterium]
MSFSSLGRCIDFLSREHELVRIKQEVDPDLEMAEIHRRVFEANGPAILFERVKGSKFPAVSNLFGTYERAVKILGRELETVKTLVKLQSEPGEALKSPLKAFQALPGLVHALPRKRPTGSVLDNRAGIEDLPMVRCWPKDGGAFILLPQVCSQNPGRPGIFHSNVGMYRVQLSGNEYAPGREIGLHYQIHRGIGNHHAKALEQGKKLKVSIFVGGPPAHTLAAVMPLPEHLPEPCFAGALAGRRFRYTIKDGYVISLDADFCITGTIAMGTKPEGPFGDHLGYYSLCHQFPYLKVDTVYHRNDAVWPFTVVGRPPQEDSVFGRLIHEMTEPAVPVTIPGVTAVHAVDAAGVHPLLLAKARERYTPYEPKQPRELLTHACAILGSGQLSLAKYLFIAAHEDNPGLDISNEMDFFVHCLERVDFTRDLHFHTSTTIDTLDYSSEGLNTGSKVVIAAAGEKRRTLLTAYPSSGADLPAPFSSPRLAAPGMVVVKGPGFTDYDQAHKEISLLAEMLAAIDSMKGLPLFVIADDPDFAAGDFAAFLWTTFSRSNPSHDIHGAGSFTRHKHWGCRGPLIIDARTKPFHAPPLVNDPEVEKRVDRLGKKGQELYGII